MKITRNDLKNFRNVVIVGYCELSPLLRYFDRYAVNSGVYGWNYDAYLINYNTLLLTGYRTPGEHAKRELIKEYNEKAKILDTLNGWDEKQDKAMELLQEFCKKASENK